MINLIPPSARSMVIKEYWLRVVSVWLFLVGTACLLVASLMLPTYVLLQGELVTLRDQVAQNAAESASFDQSSAALTEAMRQATLLRDMATSSKVALIERINRMAGTMVRVASYDLKSVDGKVHITLIGTADTRTALASFRDAIEADEQFVDTVLPISSLIKDRDLEFTMTLTATTL